MGSHVQRKTDVGILGLADMRAEGGVGNGGVQYMYKKHKLDLNQAWKEILTELYGQREPLLAACVDARAAVLEAEVSLAKHDAKVLQQEDQFRPSAIADWHEFQYRGRRS